MESKYSDTEQLVILKDLTNKTGILHDAQVFHLKTWPLIFLSVDKVEVMFSHKKKVLIFDIDSQKVPKDGLKNRFKALTLSCQQLLGEEYTILVKKGTKQIYSSK